MKRISLKQHIQSFNLPLLRILLVFGIFSLIISCEAEDDIPPPSAFVAPEPVEGCVQIEGVPELSEGIDFECEYPETGAFGDINGTLTIEPTENPDKEGINTSDKVMMVTQSAGVEPWAGFSFVMASKVDFSEKQTIKMKVYSPAEGQTILLKLEDATDGTISKEVPATTTVANEWEELSFTFSPSDSDKFDRLVLFFNFNGDKDAATVHYFDDIALGEAGSAEDPMKLPVTFDDPLVNYNVAPFGAEGTAFEIVTNPNLSGSNDTESLVGAITKTGAAFEGLTFNLSEALDLSGDSKTLSVKVYSEVAYTVLLKLETGVNDERSNEVRADHGGTGWETLTFDFATNATTSYLSESDPGGDAIVPSGQYDQISLFLDFNGSAAGTFYVDDLVHMGGDGGTSAAPNGAAPTPTDDAGNVQSIFSDTYTDPAGVNYYPNWGQSTTFEMLDFDGNKVIKYGNANYQGIEFGEALDLTSYTTLKIDVWSGDYTSIPIFLISAGSGEKPVSMTVTPNQWNTIEIPLADFTSQGLNINDIIQIKFDVQPAGGTFYIDNLYFSNETGGNPTEATSLPIDFESNETLSGVFEGGSVSGIPVANPDMTGNNSATVYKFTKGNGSPWYSGIFHIFPADIDLTQGTTFSIKFWSPKANVNVRFQLEKEGSDASPNISVDQTVTQANTWVTLTYDFAGIIDTNNAYDKFVIFPDFDDAAQGAGDGSVYYIDDIKQIAGGDGGGDTSNLTQIDLPVDFESSTVDYTLTDFGDNISSVVVDPTDANNNVAKVIKPITAPTWAGTTIGKPSGFASNIPITLTNSKMTVRVWSPEAGTPIRLKLEDANDPTHTVETEVNTTVAGDWETLEFDFTNQAPGTESLSVGLNNGWVYNKASIFFNFGTDGATAGEKTYYFDDVLFIQ